MFTGNISLAEAGSVIHSLSSLRLSALFARANSSSSTQHPEPSIQNPIPHWRPPCHAVVPMGGGGGAFRAPNASAPFILPDPLSGCRGMLSLQTLHVGQGGHFAVQCQDFQPGTGIVFGNETVEKAWTAGHFKGGDDVTSIQWCDQSAGKRF